MAASEAMVPSLDGGQIKKAVQALLAHHMIKQKPNEKQLLKEDQKVFMMVTVWKIVPREQVIKITLPHSILPATAEVCLFTKDEPSLTAEQTENLYRKLLTQHGITNVTEVIAYKTLKKEYKPFEAKRRLLNRFALFLSDDRIRRLLPSHIGKHFYARKKAPLSVNLKAKNLAKEINKRIQGTTLPMTNKGCCYTANIGHTGMTADEISENIAAAAKTIAAKAPKIWQSVKILHVKTNKSVALPIFTSSNFIWDSLQEQPSTDAKQVNETEVKKKKRRKATKEQSPGQKGETAGTNGAPSASRKLKKKKKKGMAIPAAVVEPEEEDDDEMPHLVPIDMMPEHSYTARDAARDPPALFGKRKTSPSQGTPFMNPDMPEDESDLQCPILFKEGKTSKPPKQRIMRKKLRKTPQKSDVKVSETPKMEKVVRSAKRGSKTPKQLQKMKVRKSV